MQYTIKAIPTTYAGVNFRSRLEARWAAFFDLCGWKWDYEPFDLDGWAPDFMLVTKIGNMLVEVKPSDLAAPMRKMMDEGKAAPIDLPEYNKAAKCRHEYQVLLLGISPLDEPLPIGLPTTPPRWATYTPEESFDVLTLSDQHDPKTGEYHDVDAMWREAGNIVQWTPQRRAA